MDYATITETCLYKQELSTEYKHNHKMHSNQTHTEKLLRVRVLSSRVHPRLMHDHVGLPLLSSTTPMSLRSSTVSNPEEASFTRHPLLRGRELTARCIPGPAACTHGHHAPPTWVILINAHHAGGMAQGGLKKRSDKFAVAKSKSSRKNKPLGPKKGGNVCRSMWLTVCMDFMTNYKLFVLRHYSSLYCT